jgi:hypothetical protein
LRVTLPDGTTTHLIRWRRSDQVTHVIAVKTSTGWITSSAFLADELAAAHTEADHLHAEYDDVRVLPVQAGPARLRLTRLRPAVLLAHVVGSAGLVTAGFACSGGSTTMLVVGTVLAWAGSAWAIFVIAAILTDTPSSARGK